MTEQSGKKGQENTSVESELNELKDKTARIGVQQLFFAESTTDLSNILGKQLILALAHNTTQKMTTYHKRWRWGSEARCLYGHYPGTLTQGEVIRTTCHKQLVTPMGPAPFNSCYSWWPHHVKSSCLSSEIQQAAASTVAWATNRLKEENTALPILPSSLLRRKRTLSLKAFIYFFVRLYLKKKEDPNSWIPSLCVP